MAGELKVPVVHWLGHAVTPDGKFAVLRFRQHNGDGLALALPAEQSSALFDAAMKISANVRAKRGAEAGPPTTFQVERWRMASETDKTVLTFRVVGGMEFQFEVTAETVRDDP